MRNDEQQRIFTKNLNRYVELSGKTQREIADALGVSPQTFNTWCQGIAIPRMGKIQALSDYFGINKSDLVDNFSQNDTEHKIKGVRIPVLGYVRAGIPVDAMEEILDWEEIHPSMAATGDFFALKIKGDSMEPRITAGDVVIVKEQSDVDSGDIAIVLVNGDDATVKKLMKYENGSIALVAFNPSYAPMVFTPEQIESLPVQVIGKVVELRGKF